MSLSSGLTAQESNYTDRLRELLQADKERIRLLKHLADMHWPDCWVAAGFVRNLVWDHYHDLASQIDGDVDVIWFGPRNATEEADKLLQSQLQRVAPSVLWSVKNQGRMHKLNGDDPYLSTANAMWHWPETATAVGVRLENGNLEVLAPFGLSDLFNLIIRPTPSFHGARQDIIVERMQRKSWLERWPQLNLKLIVN